MPSQRGYGLFPGSFEQSLPEGSAVVGDGQQGPLGANVLQAAQVEAAEAVARPVQRAFIVVGAVQTRLSGWAFPVSMRACLSPLHFLLAACGSSGPRPFVKY